jgi:hypothetical protein
MSVRASLAFFLLLLAAVVFLLVRGFGIFQGEVAPLRAQAERTEGSSSTPEKKAEMRPDLAAPPLDPASDAAAAGDSGDDVKGRPASPPPLGSKDDRPGLAAEGGPLFGKTYVFGSPAGGIPIRASGRGCIFVAASKEDGSFSFPRLKAGTYTLSATYMGPEGTYSDQRDVEVKESPERCDLRIGEGASGEVKGQAFYDSFPLHGAPVMLSAPGFNSKQVTGADGSFLFPRVPVGTVRLEARMEDKQEKVKKKEIDLNPGESVFVRIDFESGTGILSGRVREDGKDLALAFVRVEQVAGADALCYEAVVPVQSGAWRVELLPQGRYRVSVDHRWTVRYGAEVASGRETRLDISIDTGDASVEGTAFKGEGPLEPSQVRVLLFMERACALGIGQVYEPPLAEDGLFAEGRLSRSGTFLFKSLPAGRYELAAVRIAKGRIADLRMESLTLLSGDRVKKDL